MAQKMTQSHRAGLKQEEKKGKEIKIASEKGPTPEAGMGSETCSRSRFCFLVKKFCGLTSGEKSSQRPQLEGRALRHPNK